MSTDHVDTHDGDGPSEGLGDTIAKVTRRTGLDRVAAKIARASGKKDCGCNRRRKALNRAFPYGTKESAAGVEQPSEDPQSSQASQG